MSLTDRQTGLLQEWNEAKQQLAAWTLKESELRDKVVESIFNKTKVEGSETIKLEAGWKLTATKKLNYTLDNTDNKIAIICASLPDIVSRSLVRWKPDLVLSAWRTADAQTRELFQDVLHIKQAKVSLELLPPKE